MKKEDLTGSGEINFNKIKQLKHELKKISTLGETENQIKLKRKRDLACMLLLISCIFSGYVIILSLLIVEV